MATLKYEDPGSVANMATTELNSLANNARALGVEYDNRSAGANNFFWGEFELAVTFGTAPTAGSIVELYLIPCLDGTNYATGDASAVPQNGLYVGGWEVQAVTSAQRLVLRGVVLPPCRFKALVKNATGQAFPSSGSTVRMLPSREQSV